MARDAGVIMEKCCIHEESGRYHFMTKRFDRTDEGQKLHMQTLGAMAHFDYKTPGVNSYEQAAEIMYRLGMKQDAIEQFYT